MSWKNSVILVCQSSVCLVVIGCSSSTDGSASRAADGGGDAMETSAPGSSNDVGSTGSNTTGGSDVEGEPACVAASDCTASFGTACCEEGVCGVEIGGACLSLDGMFGGDAGTFGEPEACGDVMCEGFTGCCLDAEMSLCGISSRGGACMAPEPCGDTTCGFGECCFDAENSICGSEEGGGRGGAPVTCEAPEECGETTCTTCCIDAETSTCGGRRECRQGSQMPEGPMSATDAGMLDAGATGADAGESDAAASDAAEVDAEVSDAAEVDAEVSDAADVDTEVSDAGESDAAASEGG